MIITFNTGGGADAGKKRPLLISQRPNEIAIMSGFSQDVLLENWPRRDVDTGSDDRLLCAAEKEEVVQRQRGTLLQDWPRRDSMTTASSFDSTEAEDEDDVTSASVSRDVHVGFSETSQLYVYERESMSLLRSLSYAKKDYDKFGKEALLEGLRIQNIIATTPSPHNSNAESVKYLLHHDIISREELLGIEHFILGKPSTVLKIRRLHAAAVLWTQQELQHQQLEDRALNLGKFAQSSSLRLRSTQGARIRAGRF
eukprot:scaffold1675_cov146-Skeletonema_menzelii.AAC.19